MLLNSFGKKWGGVRTLLLTSELHIYLDFLEPSKITVHSFFLLFEEIDLRINNALLFELKAFYNIDLNFSICISYFLKSMGNGNEKRIIPENSNSKVLCGIFF